MRFGSYTQRHGSVDDRANLSRTRGLKGFMDIGKMSSGSADDAQPLHVKPLHVQVDVTTAMGTRGHESPAYGQTV
jgi:hypothetical protein